MLNENAKKIIERIYETVSGIGFMPKEIEGNVIILDKKRGTIKIADDDCKKTLYTITISNG